MFLFVGTANAQNERRPAPAQADAVISVGSVTGASPAVELNAVSKMVAPGAWEIDPNSVRGKRLILPMKVQGGAETARFICIGKWKNGECKGIYIEW
ncbi:MAG: hypothetical protein ABR535_10665 [Pyrinomonadaceae bacterium]